MLRSVSLGKLAGVGSKQPQARCDMTSITLSFAATVECSVFATRQAALHIS